MYWRLVLPANEHLIANPSGLSSEFIWTSEGYCWGRRPPVDQVQLESWIARHARDPLPEQANCYLFSGLGPQQAEVGAAKRTWIVLWPRVRHWRPGCC